MDCSSPAIDAAIVIEPPPGHGDGAQPAGGAGRGPAPGVTGAGRRAASAAAWAAAASMAWRRASAGLPGLAGGHHLVELGHDLRLPLADRLGGRGVEGVEGGGLGQAPRHPVLHRQHERRGTGLGGGHVGQRRGGLVLGGLGGVDGVLLRGPPGGELVLGLLQLGEQVGVRVGLLVEQDLLDGGVGGVSAVSTSRGPRLGGSTKASTTTASLWSVSSSMRVSVASTAGLAASTTPCAASRAAWATPAAATSSRTLVSSPSRVATTSVSPLARSRSSTRADPAGGPMSSRSVGGGPGPAGPRRGAPGRGPHDQRGGEQVKCS